MDPKVDGQMQHEWKWLKAAYLFLGGLGAGAYAIAAVNSFVGGDMAPVVTVGLWIAFPAAFTGSILLTAALGSPSRAVLAAKKQGSSWISRGTLILSGFMLLAFLHLVLDRFTSVGTSVINVIAAAGIVFAVGTMAYTGILLSASKGIPFWRTGMVPVVFLISALMSGHFAIMVGVTFAEGTATLEPLRSMARGGAVLVVLELLAVVFFLQSAHRHPDSRESAERMVREGLFILGYVVLGLAIPLVLLLITYGSLTESGAGGGIGAAVVIGAVLGLIGRLILRQAILASGAFPTLNMAGFEFRRIARPKDPKPSIGMLPPR
jgi:formate-dependent nitrite reductase membrane component NrfD